jgi:hypothetical protein
MVPMRSCIACRSRESSKGLLHVVAIKGQVTPDPDRRLPGRGAWLHPRCFEVAKARRSFHRALKAGEDLLTTELEIYLNARLIDTKEQK